MASTTPDQPPYVNTCGIAERLSNMAGNLTSWIFRSWSTKISLITILVEDYMQAVPYHSHMVKIIVK